MDIRNRLINPRITPYGDPFELDLEIRLRKDDFCVGWKYSGKGPLNRAVSYVFDHTNLWRGEDDTPVTFSDLQGELGRAGYTYDNLVELLQEQMERHPDRGYLGNYMQDKEEQA